MDTIPTPPTPTADERLAAVERQLAALRADFDATKFLMQTAYDAGWDDCLESATGAPPREAPRARARLRLVSGGAR